MAGDSRLYEVLDQILEEFAARYRRGERPAIQEFIDRHPDLADDIRAMLPAMVGIEQVKGEAKARPPAPPPGRLGDYVIVREVGRGGMGVVYEAEQESLGRRVALKVLPAALLNPAYLERFRREAKAAARLHHTNIVPVFGTGEHDGVPYYAMQFIRGEGLDKVLADVLRLLRPPEQAPPGRRGAAGEPAHRPVHSPDGGRPGRAEPAGGARGGAGAAGERAGGGILPGGSPHRRPGG